MIREVFVLPILPLQIPENELIYGILAIILPQLYYNR